MASPFSWSDTLQITLSSCLPCIKPSAGAGAADSGDDEPQHHNPAINRIPRARPDELQGLLADPDTDPEAETMSLHSNPGRGKRNKKKRSSKRGSSSNNHPRTITLFGYNLFGREQPIQLPDNADDALYQNDDGRRRRRRERNESLSAPSIGTAHSTASTFDLDAAPLDADTINSLSSPSAVEAAAQAAAAADAQRLREKEERRQKRREKKELKRLAEALAAQRANGEDGEEFEGFQGSGGGTPVLPKASSGYPRIPNAMYPGGPASDSGSGSGFSGSTKDGFGRFISAPNGAPLQAPPQNDDDDEAADLDGGLYSRNQTRDPAIVGGSDSRSRTSASASDRPHARQYQFEHPDHQPPPPRNSVLAAHLRSRSRSQSYSQASSSRVNSPLQAHFEPAPEAAHSSPSASGSDVAKRRKSKSKTSGSSRTTQSRSSATTSQSHSPSIPSPISPNFSKNIVSPSTVEQGQGFFDLEGEVLSPSPVPVPVQRVPVDEGKDAAKPASGFPSTRIGGGGGGFPMTGFGSGAPGQRRTAKDFGAFLATRGDDGDDVDGASAGL